MSEYQIMNTAPTVYIDNRGQAIHGHIVYVHLLAYDEYQEVRVPSLIEGTVKKAVEELVNNRDAIANLGKAKK